MAKRKQKKAPKKSSFPIKRIQPKTKTLSYEFEADVPIYDYLAGKDLEDYEDVAQVVEDLTLDIEMGYFLQWEAVMRQEQGFPLSPKHKELLAELEDEDNAGSRTLYINELPRPTRPWYEIMALTVPKLLLPRFYTAESYPVTTTFGWPKLAQCLAEHGRELSVPTGSHTLVDTLSVETQQRLWLQHCFHALSGLGQTPALTLANEAEQKRLTEFVEALRLHHQTVKALNLTIDKLLTILVLPSADEHILVERLLREFGLESTSQRLL